MLTVSRSFPIDLLFLVRGLYVHFRIMCLHYWSLLIFMLALWLLDKYPFTAYAVKAQKLGIDVS